MLWNDTEAEAQGLNVRPSIPEAKRAQEQYQMAQLHKGARLAQYETQRGTKAGSSAQ